MLQLWVDQRKYTCQQTCDIRAVGLDGGIVAVELFDGDTKLCPLLNSICLQLALIYSFHVLYMSCNLVNISSVSQSGSNVWMQTYTAVDLLVVAILSI
jgi:hypothetical protein